MWKITPLRGDAAYKVLGMTSNQLQLQAGDQGGTFMITAAVAVCITGACLDQQRNDTCADVAAGLKWAHQQCNAGFATATWGIIMRWECILIAVSGLVFLLTCLICINGTDIIPGLWGKNKEQWATMWSHTNPNVRRKPPPEEKGDGYDRKPPAEKPKMFRSQAQQQAMLQL